MRRAKSSAARFSDAALKRDKYVHLGMKNVRTRKFDEGIVLYDLAKED